MLTEPDLSKMRNWTTRTGSYSAPAQFIGIEDDLIILHKSDGVKVKVPREHLSTRDLDYIDNIGETQFDSEDNTDSESTGGGEGGPIAASQLPKAVSARIRSYVFASDLYWFHVEALLEDGRTWKLARNYEDFYDLQIALLQLFPEEAGNTGLKRTLPYMPGPVKYVTDAITEGRRHNLDAYLKNLLIMPSRVSACMLVRQFFVPRDGDEEIGPIDWSDISGSTATALPERPTTSETPLRSSRPRATTPGSPDSSDTESNGHEVESGQTSNLSASAAETAAAGVPVDLPVHRALLDFKPQMEDELELRVGQIVKIQREYDDGWVSEVVCTINN